MEPVRLSIWKIKNLNVHDNIIKTSSKLYLPLTSYSPHGYTGLSDLMPGHPSATVDSLSNNLFDNNTYYYGPSTKQAWWWLDWPTAPSDSAEWRSYGVWDLNSAFIWRTGTEMDWTDVAGTSA